MIETDGAGMPEKKDKNNSPNQRTDAERRARQCARLANLMKVLHLISGRGRWDAKGLAEELECSQRTVHRMLSTLSMAGVPWYFDDRIRAYRIRPGFKFPLAEDFEKTTTNQQGQATSEQLNQSATQLLEDGEAFASSLTAFLGLLRNTLEQDSCDQND
jgi:predicted DNA-binding transcriptional regulator YafY